MQCAQMNPMPPRMQQLWEDYFPEGTLAALAAHPFLIACRNGEASLATLRRFLVQHQYYSRNFTRYLCAMMASLPDGDDIRRLAHNLVEEMGLDEPGAVTHAQLFQQALAECGVMPGSAPMLPQTAELIDAMFGYCRSRDPIDGLSALCLGAEAIVPTLYGALLQGLRLAGIRGAGLRFFELHVAEDEEHALTMRDIIERMVTERPRRRARVSAIADDMVALRIAMLDAIHQQGDATCTATDTPQPTSGALTRN
jgi:pyrroloquinoline-quinone synthase